MRDVDTVDGCVFRHQVVRVAAYDKGIDFGVEGAGKALVNFESEVIDKDGDVSCFCHRIVISRVFQRVEERETLDLIRMGGRYSRGFHDVEERDKKDLGAVFLGQNDVWLQFERTALGLDDIGGDERKLRLLGEILETEQPGIEFVITHGRVM